MLSVSTYASQLSTQTNIQRNQQEFDRLARQVATGVKSEDLSDYGAVDARRVLNARQEVQRLEGYNKAIDIVTPRLKAYDLQLTRMDDIAKLVANTLSTQEAYSGTDEAGVATLIDNVMNDLTSLLNEQIDGRHLWAGANYDTVPVADIAGLPALAAATPLAAAADPDLPDYYNAAPGTDANAWVEASFSPETGKTVRYGQVASAPAIQELVHALRLAKSGLDAAAAAGDPEAAQAAYADFRQQALTAFGSARNGLQAMSAAVGVDLASVRDSADANSAAINLFADEEVGITAVDTAEAGVMLTRIQTQLQATYQVTASLTKTSLVNYL